VGFVKMALRHNCTIVPVVNVGTEDIARIHYDLPIGWLPVPFLYGSDRTVPVFTPDVGQMQRIYFHFGQPIRMGQFVPPSM
jgi:1-acyl-sn-glycerol-3-phosphate acyltransferase